MITFVLTVSHNTESLKKNGSIPAEWEVIVEGTKRYESCGPFDVLIIKSNELLTSPDIEPRKNGILTQDDKTMLEQAEISQECWNDDAEIIAAKYSRDSRCNVLPLEDNPDMTTKYVLDKIKSLFKTTRKPAGMIECCYFILSIFN